MHFATSSASNWTGLVSITNWDGDWRNGSGIDQVLFGSSNAGLSAGQLTEIQFAGFPVGATMLSTGEVIPSSAPIPLTGDLDRDAHLTAADISAMMGALADVSSYQATNQLSDSDLKTLADVHMDGTIDNLDVQALIVQLATSTLSGSGGSGATTVPEPPSLVAATSALLVLFRGFRFKSTWTGSKRGFRSGQGPGNAGTADFLRSAQFSFVNRTDRQR
jgi:hypothetical protein